MRLRCASLMAAAGRVAIRASAIHPVQRPCRDRYLRCIAERGRMGW